MRETALIARNMAFRMTTLTLVQGSEMLPTDPGRRGVIQEGTNVVVKQSVPILYFVYRLARRPPYSGMPHLARQTTLPVSPFLLRSAVGSCAISIMVTRVDESNAFFRGCFAFFVGL